MVPADDERDNGDDDGCDDDGDDDDGCDDDGDDDDGCDDDGWDDETVWISLVYVCLSVRLSLSLSLSPLKDGLLDRHS